MPEEFTKVIPEKVVKLAQAEFEKSDRAILYADVQRDVAKKYVGTSNLHQLESIQRNCSQT